MPTFSNEQRIALAVGIPVAAFFLFLWFRRRRRSESFNELDTSEDVDEDTSAFASGFETTIEVKIPRAAVGAVIGKGGVNVKRIQKESGARINLKDEDECPDESIERHPTERLMLVRGERDKAKHAELMVLKIVDELPVILTEEIFVPQRACGRIIGKGGQNIRDMSRVSGAKITIVRTEDRNTSSLRTCQILGSAEQIKDAKGLLNEKIAEDTEMRSRWKTEGYETTGSRYNYKKHPCISTSQVQLHSGDSYFKVFVSAIDNPGHFWVQPITSHSSVLESLTEALDLLYLGSASDAVLNGFSVGDLCCAPFKFDSRWYRAEVLECCKDGTVDLYYVDYGDTGKVAKENLRELRKEHLQIPIQAVECSLANVQPTGSAWNDEACDEFERLTHCAEWTVIMARVVKYCGKVPCLELIDTSREMDLNINEEMVKRGYGLHNEAFPLSPPPDPRDKRQEQSKGPTDDYPANRTDSQPQDHPREGSAHKSEELYQSSQNINLNSSPEASGVERTDCTDCSTPLQSQDTADGSLHDPVRPERDSPVKAALLKRTSQDYINMPEQEQIIAAEVANTVFAEASPLELDWGQARMGVVPEEGGGFVGQPAVEGQPRPAKTACSEQQMGDLGPKEPIIVADNSLPTSQNDEYSFSSQANSAHHQVTNSQKRFVASVTVMPRSEQMSLKVTPSLETQVAAGESKIVEGGQKYCVTKSIARQHEASYAVESVTRHVTDHVTDHGMEPESVTHFDREKPSIMSEYKVKFENSKENFAVPTAGADLLPARKGDVDADAQKLRITEIAGQPVVAHVQAMCKYSYKTEGASTGRVRAAVESSSETSESSDMSPSGSLLNITGNMVIDEEEEEYESKEDSSESARRRDVGNMVIVEEEEYGSVDDSGEGSSGSDSFMSTRDDITSDTDTAGYVTAQASGSSASQECLSMDTDADTLGFESAREDVTPVNSDTEEGGEGEGGGGTHYPKTPNPRRGTLQDAEAADQQGHLDVQTVLLDTAIASYSELGYRGDTEEGLALEEDTPRKKH